jgi:hypothetical protein
MEGGAASLGRNAGPKTPQTGSDLELGCGLHIGNVTSTQGKLFMAILDTLKKAAEKATGLARPPRDQIVRLVRMRNAKLSKFKDDG